MLATIGTAAIRAACRFSVRHIGGYNFGSDTLGLKRRSADFHHAEQIHNHQPSFKAMQSHFWSS
jgi:hypothetical protein